MIYKINNIVVTEEEFNNNLSRLKPVDIMPKFVIEDDTEPVAPELKFRYLSRGEVVHLNRWEKHPSADKDGRVKVKILNYDEDKKLKDKKLLEKADKHQEKIGGRVDYDRIIYSFKPNYSQDVIDASKTKEIQKKINMQKSKEWVQENPYRNLVFTALESKAKIFQDKQAAEKQKNSGKGIACEQSKTNTREGFIPLTGDPCKDADTLTYKVKQDRIIEEGIGSYKGIKESAAKTDYSEIDWDFIEGMAKRMSGNKNKYPKDNWKKPIDINELKQSLFRHVREIMLGNYDDEGYLGHLYATALNAQIIAYQLKNNQK